MLNLKDFRVLSFDCYGTLIDWESGIINAMRPILENHGIDRDDEQILSYFSEVETGVQQPPYRRYTDVLAIVADKFASTWEFDLTADERLAFSRSVQDWPTFEDSAASLARLGSHYDLVILSNVDDDLFAYSAEKLGTYFADVITAEQVGSYKPDHRNFDELVKRVEVPSTNLLHVAQSLYHDIAPANRYDLTTVWINRRAGKDGSGATPPQDATPDLELPDLQSLANLADAAFRT